jgi:exopolysaccharide production protein ExoZ
VPLYWLVTTIKLVGLLWSASLAVNSMPSWSEVLRSYCFIPYRHPDGNVTVLVIVGWTLVFEMFFYVIFAFGIATRRNKVQFLTVVMGLIGAIGLFRRPDWPVASFVVDPLVLEFLAGVYLAKLVMVRPRVLPRTVAWGVCLSWIIYLSLFSGWEDGRLRIFVAGIPAMLTVAAVVSLEDQLHRWIPGWLRTLGDASYSIYLVHGLVLPVLGVLMVRYGFFDRASAKATAVILSLVFSSFTGVFVYRICEYPLTEWLKGKARPRSRQEQLV